MLVISNRTRPLATSTFDFQIIPAIRPFYSSALSYLAINAKEAGGDLALIQTSPLFSFKCQLVSCVNLNYTTKAVRSVSSIPASLSLKGSKAGSVSR